jgi:hypothetical protein
MAYRIVRCLEIGMEKSRVALMGAFATVLVAVASSAVLAGPRAVIELFTSQGCSSCPPADELLGQLGEDPSIIAMSLPISYWDYLGWKDTLAIPGHGSRQRAYSRQRGDREVYTPQAIVDGSVQVLGSDRVAIEDAIEQVSKHPDVLTLPVSLSVAGGEIKVTAPATVPHNGEVWLCSLSRAVPVVIGRGENRGRTITYHNVVRRWSKLGDWDGAAATWTLPVSALDGDDADAVAVVVQAGNAQNPGSIVGAAIAPLTATVH